MKQFVEALEATAASRRTPPRLRRSLLALAALRRDREDEELSFDDARLAELLPRIVQFGSDEAIGLAVAITKRLTST